MTTRRRRFVVVAGSLVLALLGAELAARILATHEGQGRAQELRKYLLTGVIEEFEPHPYRVFRRNRAHPDVNEYGFKDSPWELARRPGVARILCLGGSTTEGGNPQGRSGAYPYLLERLLEEQTGLEFEVMNAGVSGWTTAEMLVAWFLTLQDFTPDVVVLHEAVNDVEPRFRSGFASDYSHWRRCMEGRPAVGPEAWLVRASDLYLHLRLMRGAPTLMDVCTHTQLPWDPEVAAQARLAAPTSLPFRRNVLSIAQSARARGAEVVLMTLPTRAPTAQEALWKTGIDEHNEHLRGLSREHGFLLVDAAREFALRPRIATEFTDLVHLRQAGNLAKARLLALSLSPWVGSLPRAKRALPAGGGGR